MNESVRVVSIGASTNEKGAWQAALGIVLVTLAVYLPSLGGEFLWDDGIYIFANPQIRLPGGLQRIWTGHDIDYQRLTSTLWWIEWRLWHMNAPGYRSVNLLLHIANALLVWRVLERVRVPFPWLAALLFAVHPVAVASAAWIVEGKNTLSTLFFFTAILCVMRAQEQAQLLNWKWYAAGLLAFAGALLSKGSAVVLPAVLILTTWWLNTPRWRRDLMELLPFCILAAGFSLVTIRFQERLVDINQVVLPPVTQRFAVAGTNVWFYLSKAALPVRLSPVYAPLPPMGFAPLGALLGCFAIFAIFRATWGRSAIFALGYFVIVLLPVLGFFRISLFRITPIADHWQYLALPAIGGAFACAAGWLSRVQGGVFRFIPAICVVVLCCLTYERNRVFNNSYGFWSDAVSKNPQSAVAHVSLAVELYRHQQPEAAANEFNTALRLQPDSADTHSSLGTVLTGLRRFEEAEVHHRRAVELAPRSAMNENNYGAMLESAGRDTEAVEHYQRAVSIDSQMAAAHANLSRVLARRQEFAGALVHARAAVELGSQDPDDYVRFGSLLEISGDMVGAAEQYRRALKLDPLHVNARERLSSLTLHTNKRDE